MSIINRPLISDHDEWYNDLDNSDRWEYYNKVVLYSLKLEQEVERLLNHE